MTATSPHMHTAPETAISAPNAMVMAAGLGTRMRPLTESVPKPLIELQGKALIDYALDRLRDAGVRKVVVNMHYLADAIEDHLKDIDDLEIVTSDERARLLDTGGGAARMLDELGPGPFFVINADSVWLEGVGHSLRRMLQQWDDDIMDCMILNASTVTSVGYEGKGDFLMDEEGRIARRDELDVAPFVNTGAYLIHPRLFEDCPEGPFSMNVLWDKAIENGRLYGLRHEGVWMHVGTPDALDEAEYLLSDHDSVE